MVLCRASREWDGRMCWRSLWILRESICIIVTTVEVLDRPCVVQRAEVANLTGVFGAIFVEWGRLLGK